MLCDQYKNVGRSVALHDKYFSHKFGPKSIIMFIKLYIYMDIDMDMDINNRP